MAALDDGLSLAANEAAMLARTYVQAANIGAQAAVYKQNEDVIKGYKWLATLDNRTCQNCAVGDGHVYGIHDKRPGLPLHPGCRCLWLPVTKSFRELGLDIDEFREAARPWTIRKDGVIGYGGKEIEQVGHIEGRFKDWYFSLPPENRARTSIGPNRRRLLEEKRVAWDDLMDFETGKIYTLKELAQKFPTVREVFPTGNKWGMSETVLAKDFMQNVGLAIARPSKGEDYLLTLNKNSSGYSKSQFLRNVLGYETGDGQLVLDELTSKLPESLVKETRKDDHGDKVTVISTISSKNGTKTAQVEVVWIYEEVNHDGKYTRYPSLVTMYPGKKKKGKS